MARTRQYLPGTKGSAKKTAYGASGFQMRSMPLLGALAGGCQFIAGDPLVELKAGRDPHCGETRQEAVSYCLHHHRICRPPSKAPPA